MPVLSTSNVLNLVRVVMNHLSYFLNPCVHLSKKIKVSHMQRVSSKYPLTSTLLILNAPLDFYSSVRHSVEQQCFHSRGTFWHFFSVFIMNIQNCDAFQD